MKDRRRHPRQCVQWPLRVGHRTDGCLYGTVADVGAGGILFLTSGRLAIGELVEAEIAVNPLFTIRCAVQIVRAHEVEDGEWVYGAEFVRLAARNIETVLAMLAFVA